MVTFSEDICFLFQAEAAKFLLEIDFDRREMLNLSLDIIPFLEMSNEVRILFRFHLSFCSICLQVALQGQFAIVSIDEIEDFISRIFLVFYLLFNIFWILSWNLSNISTSLL